MAAWVGMNERQEWVNSFHHSRDVEYAMGYINGLMQEEDYAPPVSNAPEEHKLAYEMGYQDGEADAS